MLKEWAQALVSHVAIVFYSISDLFILVWQSWPGLNLYSTKSIGFDPAKCVAVLNPEGQANGRPSTSSAANFASIGMDTIGGLAVLVKNIGDIVNANWTPTPFTWSNLAVPAKSPVLPSPSQLTQFLVHAETNLGVWNATSYESSLQHKWYGLDILPHVLDKALEEVGIYPGDVIHLKDGAITWWNGPDLRRKRVDEEQDISEPPAKCDVVDYERQFDNGGVTILFSFSYH